MSVVSTLLFGSLARADHSAGSDTDLLMVSLDESTHHVSIGHLSLFVYPWFQLQADARDGDLFVCHLVQEAKPLLDPEDYLAKLRSVFRFKSSYRDEIERAIDFGMYLVRYGDEINSALLTKRALWCIRTILIARSAEKRAPVFAPHRLAELTHSSEGSDLLTNRRISRDSTTVRLYLHKFLQVETVLDRALETADRTIFVERFIATSNRVALQTLRQEERSRAGYFE